MAKGKVMPSKGKVAPAPAPKVSTAKAKSQAAKPVYNATNAAGKSKSQSYLGKQGITVDDPNIAYIMAQSGSTNPADPYNWAGIAAAMEAEQASAASSGGYNPPSPGYTPSEAPAAPPQLPSNGGVSLLGPEVATAPQPVIPPPVSAVGEDTASMVGPAQEAFGVGGTFGQFERRRKARGPRTGLSVTPEMLQSVAARRLG